MEARKVTIRTYILSLGLLLGITAIVFSGFFHGYGFLLGLFGLILDIIAVRQKGNLLVKNKLDWILYICGILINIPIVIYYFLLGIIFLGAGLSTLYD